MRWASARGCDFSRFEANLKLPAERFRFSAPAGADVLQQ